MKELSIGSIVVTEGGRPIGIVTRGDLFDRFPEADVIQTCACCGLTRHLETDRFGHVLCVYCRERAVPDDWFELGGHG
jgi:hypothetical protein